MMPRRSSGRPRKNLPGLELSPDRAFVVQLDRRARPPRHMLGRVEHVASGQVAHIASARELLAFVAKVLRQGSDET